MNDTVRIKKLHSVVGEEDRHINVTHVTIRQSIFFLIMKLLVLEVMTASAVVVFHLYLISTNIPDEIAKSLIIFGMPLFIILVLLKIIFMSYIIIEWIEEYYEITPNEVIHKKGLIFKKEKRYSLEHIRSVALTQGVFGRIFNYGTLSLHDWLKDIYIHLYLIHSPRKYNQILQTLIPEADKEKQVFRENLLEPEDEY